jgi:peptide/nickel transport system substrate-binding protein
MVQALKANDIDYARAVPVEQFNRLKTEADPKITTVAGKSNGWVELGFNSYGTGTGKTIKGGGPSTKALQDPKFRDALGYAIDKPALLDKVIGGYGDVATTNVPPVIVNTEANPPFAWHTEPTNVRTFDLEVAKQKLDAAGYPLNAAKERLDKEGKVLSLHLVMPDSSPTYPVIAQFIQDWFGQLGIKVKSDQIEENSLYDIMLPPEADADGNHYTASYDLFIWSWYGGLDPNVLLQITLCDQIGSSSDSLWCDPTYDKLYADQNAATNDTDRKRIIDQMQQYFYDQAPYHLLYYDDELDAYRTDRFAGWQNQPLDTGVPLFSYSVIDYSFLTDAKAVASAEPSAQASGAAGSIAPGGSANPAPSASSGTAAAAATPAPSGGANGSAAGSSTNVPLLVIGAVLVIGGIGAGWAIARRRRTAADEE